MDKGVLAVDYDGTLATNGIVAAGTLDALERLRESGYRIVLVTGRRLDSLRQACPEVERLDRVVAENGATLWDPGNDVETLLAAPPPDEFVWELRRRNVHPLDVGRVVVATWDTQLDPVREVVRSMSLDLQIILNKGALMVLPTGVDKASGLSAALATWGIHASRTVAVGDAENDEAMLRMCGVSAAVANALDSVKQIADVVLSQPRGAGVEELITRLLTGDS